MITKEKAHTLRRLIEKVAVSLTDEDALKAVELFPLWVVGVSYEAGIRIRYESKLYKCVQAHTSQADWTPSTTPALWTEVAEPGEIPVWRQPIGAVDAYNKGDKVHYPDADSPVYESIIDANTWPPDIYGWELVN